MLQNGGVETSNGVMVDRFRLKTICDWGSILTGGPTDGWTMKTSRPGGSTNGRTGEGSGLSGTDRWGNRKRGIQTWGTDRWQDWGRGVEGTDHCKSKFLIGGVVRAPATGYRLDGSIISSRDGNVTSSLGGSVLGNLVGGAAGLRPPMWLFFWWLGLAKAAD